MNDLLLKRGLKLAHLRLIDAVANEGQVSRAAAQLGITQPAASRLAQELERLLGAPAYTRQGRGVVLSPEGVALAQRARRILQELGDAGRELSELGSGRSGHVRIGAVTGPAIEHVLPVIRLARVTTPGIAVSVEVGTSDMLGPRLLDGEIDFCLSRLPEGFDPALFCERPVGTEPVSLMVRAGHPLLSRERVEIDDLLAHDWVLPSEGAILRRTLQRALRQLRQPMPQRIVSTSSILFTLVTVQQTNAIAPLASAVVRAFARADGGIGEAIDHPGLAVLHAPLAIEVEPFALLTRAGQKLTPAAELLHDLTWRSCMGDGAAA